MMRFNGRVEMRAAESGIKLPDLLLPVGFKPKTIDEVVKEAQRLLRLPIEIELTSLTSYDPITGRVRMFI
jgi:hypothetical protein